MLGRGLLGVKHLKEVVLMGLVREVVYKLMGQQNWRILFGSVLYRQPLGFRGGQVLSSLCFGGHFHIVKFAF